MVSILGMLAMPFLIAGLLGFAIWRASRVKTTGPPGLNPAPGRNTRERSR